MQVRCVKAFGQHVPGDVAEVPDGAAVDPEHFEPVPALLTYTTPLPAAPPPPAAAPPPPPPPLAPPKPAATPAPAAAPVKQGM